MAKKQFLNLESILIGRFLLKKDLSSYDPYDIWKTRVGINVKKLYYKNKYIGIIPAGILSIYDLYLNNKIRLGYRKQEYPVVRAQATLSLLNFYKKNNNNIYLKFAKEHIDWLIKHTSQGYSGDCWGTGFTIVISKRLSYDKNVPFTTNTPYVLEALNSYYQITRDKDVLEVIKSIFQFYENDLFVLEEDAEILALSYGPFKDRTVTNAISYTMYAYSIFYKHLEDKEYILSKIKKMYNFLIRSQRNNGSWFYSPVDKESFIDCFHSVFILKNIIKTNAFIPLELSEKVVDDGYSYIVKNFFNNDKYLFRRFSLSNKPSLVKFDLYDNAEMLQLTKLMNDRVLENKLNDAIMKYFVSDSFDVYSVIDFKGNLFNKNMLRWAVMPYVYALSLKNEAD